MPKDNKNKNKKEKKHFFREFKAELKKVIWPTPKQLVNNTVAVITIVLITAIIVFVLDLAFEKINSFGVNKLKEVVGTKNEVSSEDNTIQLDEASNEVSVETSEEQATSTEEVSE